MRGAPDQHRLHFFSPTSAPAAAAPEQNPRQLTQEWYAALGEFDTAKMYLITKPEKRPRLEDRLKRVDSVILGAADLQKQKFFEMRYSTLSGDGQLAQVRVIGKSSAVRTGLISNVDTTVDLVK